jgi:hypothetical protein
VATDARVLRIIAAAPELVAAAVAGFALPLMVLLLAGHLDWPLAWPLGLAGAAAAVAIARTSPEPVERPTVLATIAAFGLCVIWAIVNSFYTAQDLYAHRDPTTYNLAARWLMDHPRMPIPTHPELFGSPAGYVDMSAGFQNSSAGHVYAQGNHLLPVLLAAAGKLFGVGGVLTANVAFAAAALFVLFGLARRIVGPGWALVVLITFAVSLPVLYVARDTLSEPLALLLLVGGLLLLHRAIAYRRTRDFALAGFVAATAATVRIDAYLALLALVVVAAVLLAAAPVGARAATGRQVGALLGAGVVPAWIGWADVAWLSSGYYHDERTHILAQIAAIVAFAVVGAIGVLIVWRPPVRAWVSAQRVRYRAAAIASWVLVAGFAFLASRPLWLVAHGGGLDLYLKGVQERAGDRVDITRTYAEQSVSWQALYFGWPTVVFAVAGYVLLLRRFLRERDYVLLGFLVMGLSLSALYLWTPQITPDQIYAARRFVPVIMPALVVAAAFALRSVGATFGRRGRTLAIIGALAMIAIPIAVTVPAFTIREEVPQLRQVDAICAAVGRSGAVLELDQSTQYSYQQTIRSYCNVPTLGLPKGATPAELARIRTALSGHGRSLFVLSASPKGIGFDPGGGTPKVFSSVSTTRWPSTLHTAPSKAATEVVTVYLGSVGPDGLVTSLVRAS